jgi:hypothetical protein
VNTFKVNYTNMMRLTSCTEHGKTTRLENKRERAHVTCGTASGEGSRLKGRHFALNPMMPHTGNVPKECHLWKRVSEMPATLSEGF